MHCLIKAQSGLSKRNIAMQFNSPQTKNCVQASLTPSVFGATLSMTKIWNENTMAHKKVKKSPKQKLISAPNRHKKYIPKTAKSTPDTIFRFSFLPAKIPMTETKIIYSAVMNPLFPAVVSLSPSDCSVEATHSSTPQTAP